VADGLLHTFMTILTEFGIFEENINNELQEQLPFLASSQILMSCVKAGMGREVAYEFIKKHATTNTAGNFFEALSGEKNFPLSFEQLNELIKNPADFAGSAIEQSRIVADEIRNVTKGQISEVKLESLI
jgi:adenylosuccinate lyase